MWGCFARAETPLGVPSVFPTHVGVFLSQRLSVLPPRCLPHACGGVSKAAGLLGKLCESSPRMWGCFSAWIFRPRRDSSLPHACGGVSSLTIQPRFRYASSPRMWGCFLAVIPVCYGRGVFPTHVGVFPPGSLSSSVTLCLPHACGGVSHHVPGWRVRWRVFPTHVGVFP